MVVVLKPDETCEQCDLYKAYEHEKLRDMLLHDMRVTMLVYEATTNGVVSNSVLVGSGMKETVQRHLTLLPEMSIMRVIPKTKITPHPDLLGIYWKWWPNFLLFSTENLNAPYEDNSDESSDDDSYLVGSVYYGDVETHIQRTPNGPVTVHTLEARNDDQFENSAKAIYTWILQQVENLLPHPAPLTFEEFRSRNPSFMD